MHKHALPKGLEMKSNSFYFSFVKGLLVGSVPLEQYDVPSTVPKRISAH